MPTPPLLWRTGTTPTTAAGTEASLSDRTWRRPQQRGRLHASCPFQRQVCQLSELVLAKWAGGINARWPTRRPSILSRMDTPLQDLPVLRRWMGDTPGHPLRSHIDRPSRYPGVVRAWWRDPWLTTVEEMLVVLEQARPVGLDSMVRTFRAFDDPSWEGVEQFLQHRAELVIASLLAGSGVPFRFNTAAGPDLLLDTAPACAIEISSRSPKSLSALSRMLSAGLRARGLPAGISITADPIPPVEIRSRVLDEIVRQFLPPDGSPGVMQLRIEAAPRRPEDGIPASWITVTRGGSGTTSFTAPYNSPHMTALAQSVATNVLREKRKLRQSRTLPTLLVVDVSRTDLPDLRC